MTLEEIYRMYYSGYLGVSEMDEYTSKEYVLKDIEKLIKEHIDTYKLNLDYDKINDELDKQDLIRKLQDAILVLNLIDGPLELKLLIRAKLKELGN